MRKRCLYEEVKSDRVGNLGSTYNLQVGREGREREARVIIASLYRTSWSLRKWSPWVTNPALCFFALALFESWQSISTPCGNNEQVY